MPLDENHSVFGEDDGQIADLGVGLILVFCFAAAPTALHTALDQLLFSSSGVAKDRGDIGGMQGLLPSCRAN